MMFVNLLSLAIGLSVVPFGPVGLAQTAEEPSGAYGYRHGPGMMWGGGAWGTLGMFLGQILAIGMLGRLSFGIRYLLRAMGVVRLGRDAAATHQNVVALLQERYASGENDTKQHEERGRLLVQ